MHIPANLNPAMLKWARERSSLSLDEAAALLGIAADRRGTPGEILYALESGNAQPSQHQLEDYAKKYKLPITVFYLNTPPAPSPAVPDYRLFPDSPDPALSGPLIALIDDLCAKQALARELLLGHDTMPTFTLPAVNWEQVPVGEAVTRIRQYLKEKEQSSWSRPRNATELFKELRSRIEYIGVIVNVVGSNMPGDYNFDRQEFRGLALWDDIAPIIAVNGLDAHTAQVFTLIHEFVHVITRTPSISNSVGSEASYARVQDPERYCNESAAEFLLPDSLFVDFPTTLNFEEADIAIRTVADDRHVSKPAVAIRFRRMGYFSEDTLQTLVESYRPDAPPASASVPTDNSSDQSRAVYFPMKVRAAGHRLIRLVGTSLEAQRLSYTRAATILGVHPANVTQLIKFANV